VVPLNWPLQAPSPQDMRWLRVEEASAVAACRAAVQVLAERLRFPAARIAQLALAVTEAASNLHKHAEQGALLLCVNRDGPQPGIDLVTIDAGPGVPDVSAAVRGHGTALAARFCAVPAGGPPAPGARRAGLLRPITGETECGDAYGAVQDGDTVTAVLCDGLGHGPLAAAAAAAGVAAVLEDPAGEPAALLERVHRRMNGSRGGAVGIVRIGGQLARFAGLGNVAASIVSGGQRKSMLSIPGIAGHQARTIRQFEYEVPPGSAVILHSDGVSNRWEAAALPGIEARDPLLVAAVLLAQAGVHRDDAGVLVLKP